MNGPPEKPPGDAPNRGTVLNESDAGKHSRPVWSATGNVRHGEPLNGPGYSGNNVAHSAPQNTEPHGGQPPSETDARRNERRRDAQLSKLAKTLRDETRMNSDVGRLEKRGKQREGPTRP